MTQIQVYFSIILQIILHDDWDPKSSPWMFFMLSICPPLEIKMYMTKLPPYMKYLTTGHLVPVNI